MKTPAELRRIRPSRFEEGEVFVLWPIYPGDILQYGKYYLRWIEPKKRGHSFYPRRGTPQISIDEVTWQELKYSYYWKKDNNLPDWYNEEELKEEIKKVRKAFFRKRANVQAKARRIAIKAEAKETDQSVEEYKAEKSVVRIEKATKKRKAKKAKKMVKITNDKMTIAMALKDLRDAIATLQTKLEDTECDLVLPYVGSRIHKITEATCILEQWTKEREKSEQ